MTKSNSTPTPADPTLPYGSNPRRSKAPLIILGLLYAAWFLTLLWMAAYHIGR